jgi:hypothetical protein
VTLARSKLLAALGPLVVSGLIFACSTGDRPAAGEIPTDSQLCREDGEGNYDCGAYSVGADGKPVPRSETLAVKP